MIKSLIASQGNDLLRMLSGKYFFSLKIRRSGRPALPRTLRRERSNTVMRQVVGQSSYLSPTWPASQPPLRAHCRLMCLKWVLQALAPKWASGCGVAAARSTASEDCLLIFNLKGKRSKEPASCRTVTRHFMGHPGTRPHQRLLCTPQQGKEACRSPPRKKISQRHQRRTTGRAEISHTNAWVWANVEQLEASRASPLEERACLREEDGIYSQETLLRTRRCFE